MRRFYPSIAIALCALLMSPLGFAQSAPPSAGSSGADHTSSLSDQPQVPRPPGDFLTRGFRPPAIAPINMGNSNRLESLIRAGKLYLSLEDAITLALENNIDIEVARYGPQVAQSDYLRAKAGGLLRGVPSSVSAAPSSAAAQAGGATGASGASSGGGGSTSTAATTGGTVITQTGPSVPVLDPLVYFQSSLSHISAPQANTITAGTSSLVYDSRSWTEAFQQSFLTGTTVSASYQQLYTSTNSPFNTLNPNTTGTAAIQVSQNLLQGFGLAVNNRSIRVAKNNIHFSDLVFQQQVNVTVAGVIGLYWDLVSDREDLLVKQKALEVAKQFYEDNKKQVEIGTLAPIEVVRAEANVATAEQDLTNSDTVLLQQETIIKDYLSRNGVASPTIALVRVIPTDQLVKPEGEYTEKLADLVEAALRQRPELAQTKVNVENSKIGLAGSRNALLPTLSASGYVANAGLVGQVNTQSYNGAPIVQQVDPYFLGGQGTLLGQVFRRNFPDYALTLTLSATLRNRSAQADYIRDSLTVRQTELAEQQQIKNIRVSVQNAWIAVIQARARYQSALKGRILQEQTLDAENKKYALGASTAFLVVQTQRDLATARASEVAALAGYNRALVNLDLQTGTVLEKNHVEMAEAKSGKSARPNTTPQN
jgi:outer membrane protein TolC